MTSKRGTKVGRARLAWATRARDVVGDGPVDGCRRYLTAIGEESGRWASSAAEQIHVADGFGVLQGASARGPLVLARKDGRDPRLRRVRPPHKGPRMTTEILVATLAYRGVSAGFAWMSLVQIDRALRVRGVQLTRVMPRRDRGHRGRSREPARRLHGIRCDPRADGRLGHSPGSPRRCCRCSIATRTSSPAPRR